MKDLKESGYEWIRLEVHDGIAFIVLNRPEKRNALNYAMWAALKDRLEECKDRDDVQIVVFRGVDESAFCAGADISEFPTKRCNRETSTVYNELTEAVAVGIQALPKPTIAMLHGFCVGGGAEIAVACDFRFASPSLKMGITPAKLGIVYGFPETKMLVDLVGPSRAKDLLFSGRFLDATEALQVGLVDFIFPADELELAAIHYAKLLMQNAQNSIRGAKTMVSSIQNGASRVTPELEQLVLDSFDSPEYQEGIRAFSEKRAPEFRTQSGMNAAEG